eukprot:TRINITY_DN2417_c0_g3_i1.p1 TRINITY_DN2417_c0_g3~~TRINITY_DN2417_c0_g3_i1.p1  ORF type:complete len:1152 (-),score=360.86 TRINITY_DN2417_c0_g3_i1:427-3882(-)
MMMQRLAPTLLASLVVAGIAAEADLEAVEAGACNAVAPDGTCLVSATDALDEDEALKVSLLQRRSFEELQEKNLYAESMGEAVDASVAMHIEANGEAARNLLEGQSGCHDITHADKQSGCYWEINNVMHGGGKRAQILKNHPEMAHASMTEWQAYLFKHSKGPAKLKCPAPCSLHHKCNATIAPKMWKPVVPKGTLNIKALSYNLYWWNLFQANKGKHWSAAKLIKSFNAKPNKPFDVMGFQECENLTTLMHPMQLDKEFGSFYEEHAICLSYRKDTWDVVDHGVGDVAEDQYTEWWGNRAAIWARLKHKETGAHLMFVNHHGPLSVNSGGLCGGEHVAHKLLQLIADNGKEGDIIILVGDFNANAASLTVQTLWKHLVLAHNGPSFGGVDNVFTNLPKSAVLETRDLGSGGSDHHAVAVTMEMSATKLETPASNETTDAGAEEKEEKVAAIEQQGELSPNVFKGVLTADNVTEEVIGEADEVLETLMDAEQDQKDEEEERAEQRKGKGRWWKHASDEEDEEQAEQKKGKGPAAAMNEQQRSELSPNVFKGVITADNVTDEVLAGADDTMEAIVDEEEDERTMSAGDPEYAAPPEADDAEGVVETDDAKDEVIKVADQVMEEIIGSAADKQESKRGKGRRHAELDEEADVGGGVAEAVREIMAADDPLAFGGWGGFAPKSLAESGNETAPAEATSSNLSGLIGDLFGASAGSCKSMGCVAFQHGRACQCNEGCHKWNDCCSDFEDVCGKNAHAKEAANASTTASNSSSTDSTTTKPSTKGKCADFGCGGFYQLSRSCQCTARCGQFGNCCDDYESVCGKHQPDSCKKQGCTSIYQVHRTCQCTPRCHVFNNCCSDYESQCGATHKPKPNSTAVNSSSSSSSNSTAHASSGSCAEYGCVGYKPLHKCQCSSGCKKHNNCCKDYESKCVAASKPVPGNVTAPKGSCAKYGCQGNFKEFMKKGHASLVETDSEWHHGGGHHGGYHPPAHHWHAPAHHQYHPVPHPYHPHYQPPSHCQCHPKCTIDGTCCTDYFDKCVPREVSVEPKQALSDASENWCGMLESNVEYKFEKGGFQQVVNKINSPRTCCTMCSRNHACTSWKWIDWVQSLQNGRCILMGGKPIGKKAKEGVVSGLSVKAARAAAAEASKEAIVEIP